jgi:hypothetical protein
VSRTYCNRWVPVEATEILARQRGSILDVGGGAAPYCRATHIVDVLPLSIERLGANAWGGETEDSGRKSEVRDRRSAGGWTAGQYTQLDLCSGGRWPLGDKQFDLGLCSHTLEDLADPFPAVRELSRVCREVLIITPSRLLEQTMGIDHPRQPGFPHHVWMVFAESGQVMFQRKTDRLARPGCHLVCPIGKTLPIELGATVFCGAELRAAERTFASEADEEEDLARFVGEWAARCSFIPSPAARRGGWRYRIWKFRQKYLGAE